MNLQNGKYHRACGLGKPFLANRLLACTVRKSNGLIEAFLNKATFITIIKQKNCMVLEMQKSKFIQVNILETTRHSIEVFNQ